jgi:aspartyl/glutamyl-tRNA(Asn/Gln) amidotransferase, C subunit
MVKISDEDIRHLAELSNITLNKDEASRFKNDIENILGYVEQLNELNTDNVEPTYQIGTLQNVWREDEVVEFDAKKEQLLNLAFDTEDGQIKVPKVL